MENVETRLYIQRRSSYTGKKGLVMNGNVRPLKRVRNVRLLNDALKSQTDHQLKKSRLHNRRDAQVIEKLKDTYKKFLGRSMGRPKPTDEDLTENRLPAQSFGTVLVRGETRNQIMESSDFSRKKMKQDRCEPLPNQDVLKTALSTMASVTDIFSVMSSSSNSGQTPS